MKFVVGSIVVLTLLVWLIPAIPVSLLGAVIVVIFGFFFATVSSRMVGLVGSSNNPVSGMAIATLLIATLILKFTGATVRQVCADAIAIGSIICIVSAIAGEGLVGILLAFLAVLGADKAIDLSAKLGLSGTVMNIGGLVLFGIIILTVLKFSLWKKRAKNNE